MALGVVVLVMVVVVVVVEEEGRWSGPDDLFRALPRKDFFFTP